MIYSISLFRILNTVIHFSNMPKYDLEGDPMKVKFGHVYSVYDYYYLRLVHSQNSNHKNKIHLVWNIKWIQLRIMVLIVIKVRVNFKIKLLSLLVNMIICFKITIDMCLWRWWFRYWPSCCFSICTWRCNNSHFIFEWTWRCSRNSKSCSTSRPRMYFIGKRETNPTIWY